MLGGFGSFLTSKASLRGEAFSHTYKLIIRLFHNQCGITSFRVKGKEGLAGPGSPPPPLTIYIYIYIYSKVKTIFYS